MVRILDADTVDRYLGVDVALDAMRRCFAFEAQGVATARVDLSHSAGWMRVLPAVVEGVGMFGHKMISFTTGVGVRYVITLFDLHDGEMRAVMDGAAITGARTGATTAVATDLLCGPRVEAAAIIGTGSVARSQLPALEAVRPVEEIRVFSRRPENRSGFIAEMQPMLQARLLDCDSVEEAIDGAGLVTLATKSTDPVFGARHLRPGMHVNSVGSARPDLAEVDPETFGMFDRVVCDSVELVFGESGDAIAAAGTGLFQAGRALSLASALAAGVPRAPTEVTLFKSTGTGLQDVVLAAAILELAEADGAGTTVDPVLSMKQFGPTGRT